MINTIKLGVTQGVNINANYTSFNQKSILMNWSMRKTWLPIDETTFMGGKNITLFIQLIMNNQYKCVKFIQSNNKLWIYYNLEV